MSVHFVWQAGQVVQDVISVTLVNATAKTIDVPVPEGEEWLLMGLKATNPDNVNRRIYVSIWKELAKTNEIRRLIDAAAVATTSRVQYPNSQTALEAVSTFYGLVHLTTNNVIEVVWVSGGVSAGGIDADGLVVEYMKIGARGG